MPEIFPEYREVCWNSSTGAQYKAENNYDRDELPDALEFMYAEDFLIKTFCQGSQEWIIAGAALRTQAPRDSRYQWVWEVYDITGTSVGRRYSVFNSIRCLHNRLNRPVPNPYRTRSLRRRTYRRYT